MYDPYLDERAVSPAFLRELREIQNLLMGSNQNNIDWGKARALAMWAELPNGTPAFRLVDDTLRQFDRRTYLPGYTRLRRHLGGRRIITMYLPDPNPPH